MCIINQSTTKTKNMNYELKVSITNNKAGKFHYQVIDENGTIISERKSNREYVACTIDGSYYFGRLDLVGKGDHGRMVKHYSAEIKTEKSNFEKQCGTYISCTFEDYINNCTKILSKIQLIAYKK